MAAGLDTFFESDGKAVYVNLTAAVSAGQLILAEGFVGLAQEDGVSGQMIALAIDGREYQFIVPTALAVAKGDTVYLTIANVTNVHTFADNAYSKTSGAGKVAAFKATAAQDSNDMVTGIFLNGFWAS